MITEEQKRFILLFIFDGERDADRTCTELGIRPSTARSWFRDAEFQKSMREAEAYKLRVMGYGGLFALEDTMAIAHSDISQVQATEEGLGALPRHVRIAIKSVEFALGVRSNGDTFVYPKKVTMHDKAWALQKAAEWFEVAKLVQAGGIKSQDEAKPIAGLIVRPPITREEAEAEELLKD